MGTDSKKPLESETLLKKHQNTSNLTQKHIRKL